MAEMTIDILELAETRWTNSSKFRKEGTTMVYSGGREHRNGVGIIMNNNIAKALKGYWPISDRIVMIKLQEKPFNINIIQLYAPTQDYNDDDIEAFSEEVQTAIKQVKSIDILCVMGDMNAKVGSSAKGNIVGKFGLGERNQRGERLIQLIQCNKKTSSQYATLSFNIMLEKDTLGKVLEV